VLEYFEKHLDESSHAPSHQCTLIAVEITAFDDYTTARTVRFHRYPNPSAYVVQDDH